MPAKRVEVAVERGCRCGGMIIVRQLFKCSVVATKLLIYANCMCWIGASLYDRIFGSDGKTDGNKTECWVSDKVPKRKNGVTNVGARLFEKLQYEAFVFY